MSNLSKAYYATKPKIETAAAIYADGSAPRKRWLAAAVGFLIGLAVGAAAF